MTNVQHQIQADRKGKIWINVSNNDPRLAIDGVIARIRPVYNHTCFINIHGKHYRDLKTGDYIWPGIRAGVKTLEQMTDTDELRY
jgi:hypothetical protein